MKINKNHSKRHERRLTLYFHFNNRNARIRMIIPNCKQLYPHVKKIDETVPIYSFNETYDWSKKKLDYLYLYR